MTNITAHMASKNLTVEKAAKKAGMTPERFQQVAGGAKATLPSSRSSLTVLRLFACAAFGAGLEASVRMFHLLAASMERFGVSTQP